MNLSEVRRGVRLKGVRMAGDARISFPADTRWYGDGVTFSTGRSIFVFMHKLTIWFDGSCPLCVREIRLIKRLDRRGAIEFLDVAAPDGTDCPVDRAELLARLHARENGALLSGAAAFAAMWRAIPLLRPLGLLARNPSVLSILERGYLAFLRVRPRLQRLARSLETA